MQSVTYPGILTTRHSHGVFVSTARRQCLAVGGCIAGTIQMADFDLGTSALPMLQFDGNVAVGTSDRTGVHLRCLFTGTSYVGSGQEVAATCKDTHIITAGGCSAKEPR